MEPNYISSKKNIKAIKERNIIKMNVSSRTFYRYQ